MHNAVQIKINLLETETGNQYRVIYWGLAILVFAIMGILAGYFYESQSRELARLQDINTKLKANVTQYNSEMSTLKPILELEKDIADKSKKVEATEKMQVSYAKIITEIDKVIPPQVIIVEVNIKAQKVVVTGFGPDHSRVAKLLEGLKGSSRFKNVTVLASQMDETSNEAKFTIEMDWEAEKK
jgi:Tfp pilus assembly protein PilN